MHSFGRALIIHQDSTNPRDPSAFSEGDWRHCYVGLEVPVVPSEVRYDWIPRERKHTTKTPSGPELQNTKPSWRHRGSIHHTSHVWDGCASWNPVAVIQDPGQTWRPWSVRLIVLFVFGEYNCHAVVMSNFVGSLPSLMEELPHFPPDKPSDSCKETAFTIIRTPHKRI